MLLVMVVFLISITILLVRIEQCLAFPNPGTYGWKASRRITSYDYPYYDRFELFSSKAQQDKETANNPVMLQNQQQQCPGKTNATIVVPRFSPHNDEAYPSRLHSIHVRTVLSPEEAARCFGLATEHAEETGCWNRPDFERHAAYATCDFAIEDCESLSSYLNDIDFDRRIWDQLGSLFDIERDDMAYLDFFCANYVGKEKQRGGDATTTTMDRLEEHRDGTLLSFTVLLTPPSKFEGGGTYFDALRDVDDEQRILHRGTIRPPRAGDAVFHSGKLLHGAHVVTAGQRTVLVGFVDVAEWLQTPGVLSTACRDFGRMDVAAHRYKRQQRMTIDGAKKGWYRKNNDRSRWLPRNCVKGFVPAFSSVERRADPEYQRRKKLEAEDVFLRTILARDKQKRRPKEIDLFNGDITILE